MTALLGCWLPIPPGSAYALMPEEGHVGREKKTGREGRLHLTPSHLDCTLFLRSLALRVLLVYNLIPRHHLSPLHTLLVPRPPQTSLPGVLTHTLLPTSNSPVVPYQSRTSSRTSDTFFKADTVLLPTDCLDPGTEPSPPSAIHTTK